MYKRHDSYTLYIHVTQGWFQTPRSCVHASNMCHVSYAVLEWVMSRMHVPWHTCCVKHVSCLVCSTWMSHVSYACAMSLLYLYTCICVSERRLMSNAQIVYICVYVCMHACMHARVYVCVLVCMYLHTYVCKYVYVNIVYACVCIWPKIDMYKQMYKYK